MFNRTGHIGSRWFVMPLAALLVTWSTGSNASEIYKWVSDDGVVHYSDTRPKNEASVTTLELRELNPDDYDPASDPHSILNQAKRMNESWTERVATQRQPGPRSVEAREEGLYASRGYPPFAYFPPTEYYPIVLPPRQRTRNAGAARQQLNALSAFDLVGQRSESINSGVHRDRVLRSQALPVVSPNRVPGFESTR